MAEMIASTYEILEKIGAGGGGVIYLAYHSRLKKKVILKADKRKVTTRPELLRREVDVLKELNHTYIPQVYDYFTEEDVVYTVIDYIEGESLDKPLKRGETFSQLQVIKWTKQVLEALDYLHSPVHGSPARGYVHSDIKPANIMRKPNDDICLIDFNIALALGDDNAIGRSQGYASPEHYGLDFSTRSAVPGRGRESSGTEIMTELAAKHNRSGISSSGSGWSGSSSRMRKVLPDIRSDIYSLGATMYHFLSGRRPAQNAKEVVPLSKKEYNPQIVDMITKAMNPNPDLRYQTAREMLDVLQNLKKTDRRVVRWKRRNRIVYTMLLLLFIGGVAASFIGLKRMQTTEKWLRLTEDAQNQLQAGNQVQALQKLLEVYEERNEPLAPEPSPKSMEILTEALGVYDLADTFQVSITAELPSAPLQLELSPEGSTIACMCSGTLLILDAETAQVIETFSTDKSALSEVRYLDDHTIVYAGAEGITVYDMDTHKELWVGEAATGIAVSGDKATIAGVYREEEYALIYDARTGKVKRTVDFGQRKQIVRENDYFINPSDNLFCLNEDGTWLAVSFSDSSLDIFHLERTEEKLKIFDDTESFEHYEGGFYESYLAFSATDYAQGESAFVIIDVENARQTGGFHSEGYFFTDTDADGIMVGTKDNLVQIDPETGEQTSLVDTAEAIEAYCRGGNYTAISVGRRVLIFDRWTNEICEIENSVSCDYLSIRNRIAVIGSANSPSIWIAKYEDHTDTEIAFYDPDFYHTNARLSDDGKTMMLFSFNQFRIYDLDGNVIREVMLPDADQVYSQQFIRDGTDSYLAVTYMDGSVDWYYAADGERIRQEQTEEPDLLMNGVFETSKYRIDSPLHGPPQVYDRATGEWICELKEDAYLSGVTETGDYIVTQYITSEGVKYGCLADDDWQVLAYLPNLCDVLPDRLLFDYPTGSIRETKIYHLDELLEKAHNIITHGGERK